VSGAYADVAAFLNSHGPCLSSKVVTHLTKQGIGGDAAKQRISRAVKSGVVARTSGVQFPHREAFLFLKEQRESPLFVNSLWNELCSASSTIAHGLYSLESRGGLIPFSHFPGVSGSPSHVKGQLSHERVFTFLLKYGLVELRQIDGLGTCVQLGADLPLNPLRHFRPSTTVRAGVVRRDVDSPQRVVHSHPLDCRPTGALHVGEQRLGQHGPQRDTHRVDGPALLTPGFVVVAASVTERHSFRGEGLFNLFRGQRIGEGQIVALQQGLPYQVI
jgi:hypothetical protein